MTIEEKLQKVGYRIILSSKGDNLQSICFRVYGEHSEIGILVLTLSKQ